jgi:hypothetical protein
LLLLLLEDLLELDWLGCVVFTVILFLIVMHSEAGLK